MLVDKLPLLVIASQKGLSSDIKVVDELAGYFIKYHKDKMMKCWDKLLDGMKEHGEFSFTTYTKQRFIREIENEKIDEDNYRFLELVSELDIFKEAFIEYLEFIGELK